MTSSLESSTRTRLNRGLIVISFAVFISGKLVLLSVSVSVAFGLPLLDDPGMPPAPGNPVSGNPADNLETIRL